MVCDTLIGQDIDTGKDVWIPYDSRSVGVTIIGKSGTGKSSLLERLILSDLECGTPGMVIDPHGLLAERIVRLTPPEYAHRLMLLEAIRTKPFGLNLLAVRDPIDEDDDPVTWAADSVIATVKKLYGEDDEFLPRLERYLDLAVRTLIPAKGTLLDAPRLFEDTGFRDTCLSRVDRHEQATLRAGWASYDRLRPGERITHTEALVNRLERLLTPPIIRGIIGCPRTTVPFEDVLAGDTMLIVSLPSDRLSPERCDFLGALLLCALADRVFARSVSASPPRLHIYLDEYQRFATSTTAELLTQGRKYGAGVTLAHQDLHQIRELRIRNASRHAGTLIVLGVTRPDAEQLAGEFPVQPRPEWTETIQEVDGTQPISILHHKPLEDILAKGHPDPEVILAAKMLSADKDYAAEQGKAGTFPRPQSFPYNQCYREMPEELNRLCVAAMHGQLASAEDFATALIRYRLFAYWQDDSPSWMCEYCPCRDLYGWSGTPFYPDFHQSKEKMFIHREINPKEDSSDRIRRCTTKFTDDCRPELTEEQKRLNAAIPGVFESERNRFLQEAVRPWIIAYATDRTALSAGKLTDAFREADSVLATAAVLWSWEGVLCWKGRVKRQQDGTYAVAAREDMRVLLLAGLHLDKPGEDPREQLQARRRYKEEKQVALESIISLREDVRWLWILCDGLRRTPVRVASGAHEPRLVTRHILHAGQTQQDALNEFVASLVNPPQRFVAHVRLPRGYHQVKLVPPVQGSENPAQLQQVRLRSQLRYPCPEYTREGSTAPGERPASQAPPTIRRRPGGRLEPPDDLPAEDEGTA